MNANTYLENMIINFGLSLSGDYKFFTPLDKKIEKEILESKILLNGIEVPLISCNNNIDKFKSAVEEAKKKFISSSSVNTKNIENDNTLQRLIHLFEIFCAESVKFYGSILAPSIDTLNLLATLVNRSLSDYNSKLADKYNVHGLKVNQIQAQIENEKNTSNTKILAEAAFAPQSVTATSKSYESSITGKTITETKYSTNYAAMNEQKMKMKNAMIHNESEAFAKSFAETTKEKINLVDSIESLITTIANDFVNKYIDIIITKHSEYFNKEAVEYKKTFYWKDKLDNIDINELDNLSQILRYYKIDVNELIESDLAHNIEDYYFNNNYSLYSGNDLNLYLKLNNIEKINNYKKLDNIIASHFIDKTFNDRMNFDESDKSVINNCPYLSDEKKKEVIETIESRIKRKVDYHNMEQKVKKENDKNNKKSIFIKLFITLIIIIVLVILFIIFSNL